MNNLSVTEDTTSEKGDKIPGGISHFTPSPSPGDSDQDQGCPNMSQVERESRFRVDFPLKFGGLTNPLPHPPNQQGEGGISAPTPALQASLLLLCRPPVSHISPRHETPNEIIKSSSVCGAQLKVTAVCEFTFKNN